MSDPFDLLRAELGAVTSLRRFGHVQELERGLVTVSGLSQDARLGDRVGLMRKDGPVVEGEVLRLSATGLLVLPEGDTDGLAVGDAAELLPPLSIAPHDGWIGRIVDPAGRPLDGRPLLRGPDPRALRGPPPAATVRRHLGARLPTGMAAFDTLLPLVRGQRLGLFAGSGVGKSSLLAGFARGVAADVVVLCLIGERGREVRDFAEQGLGPGGMARSVIVAATADSSPLLRRRAAWSAMAVAEHFRDSGRQVLLLVDSVTRFAEAHREVALAGGEDAALRGYPASTAHLVATLAERSGTGAGMAGDITAVFSVLVAGSDMEEPIADMLRGVLDGHVVLDRAIAERGRFPAVNLLRSVSRSLPAAASPAENAQIAMARRLLGAWDRAEMMIQAGLYAEGSDPDIDAARRIWAELDRFLAEPSPKGPEASFARLKEILAKSGARAGV
jgi:flagellum-specific ATP synthase